MNPVVKEVPPRGVAWKAHASSIVSIDLAEAKELIITASTDHCVCLWSKRGRYVGGSNSSSGALSFWAFNWGEHCLYS